MPLPHLGAEMDHFAEIRVRGGLAVAAQGDVVEPAQGLGRVWKPWPIEDLAGGDQVDHSVQLVAKPRQIDERFFARLGPPDLTIDAMKIANLVQVEIHADRDPAGPATEHGIDVSIGLETARVDVEQGRGREWIHRWVMLWHVAGERPRSEIMQNVKGKV